MRQYSHYMHCITLLLLVALETDHKLAKKLRASPLLCFIFQVLDTRDLTISQVTNDAGEILKHSLGDEHQAFGKPLNIELPKGLNR